MNHTEIIKTLADNSGRTQRQVRGFLKAFTGVVKEALDSGLRLTIPHWGTFETHVRKARKGFNPQTRTPMMLPKKRVVAFHSGKALKQDILHPEKNA